MFVALFKARDLPCIFSSWWVSGGESLLLASCRFGAVGAAMCTTLGACGCTVAKFCVRGVGCSICHSRRGGALPPCPMQRPLPFAWGHQKKAVGPFLV
ncbi:hypothetical protein Taro_017133 [Colocasia esculenta]|uniref:Uncharacterized protein n=1 Tax=Colocasia esculenta TaxID=4460 RepID=A0A843UMQ8_COLES|nr:hypothetical protein [Colocasia esculenta]